MEWKEVRLGDVIDYKKGFAFKSSMYKSTGTYIVRVSDTTANSVDVSLCNCISPELAHQYTDYSLKTKDIIIATVGSWPTNPASIVGKVVRVPESANNALLNQNAVRIRSNGIVDSDYLYYLLKEEHFSKYLVGTAQGSANQASITLKDIFGYSFSAPSEIKDQHRIASILSSLDRKIELNNKINADLEEMAQAIFKNWFVDFEPFKDGKFVDSELGMIPEGWKVGTLADIAEITMGQSPAGNSLNENREGMIFYQGSSDFGFRFPSIRVFTTEPKRLAVANSVLFSVRAPVGDINVAKEECCIGRGVASIKSKYGHDSYLFYTMKSLHKLFDSFDGEGTVFGSINKKTLSAIQILLPSDGIVEQFYNIASSFDDRIRSLSDENSRLSLLRDTLLPRLMSGELEVPE